ncbi:hypothetical protein PC128_g6005 [Phytophthora cactorum]|nr:hypothetical protein PC120_g8613 [Phytophthora cactorum]KAG3082483.1 hypothetical protein PC121_g6093 [Phytophthora cactorum]KAG3198460.1 hypothetical protein PC128_g6005 [Phytophthora cactorum]KAG4056259.1 hypothetical protein PC123_g8679 [Phytophthora cactorum]
MQFDPKVATDAPADLFTHRDGSSTTRVRPECTYLFTHSATSSFIAYIPLYFWQQVVNEINAYAVVKGVRLLYAVTLTALMKFIGIIFFMSINDKGEYENYWGVQPEDTILDSAKPAPARKVQAVVAAIQSDSDSESGLSGLDSDGDLRRIYLTAAQGDAQAQTPAPVDPDRATPDQVSPPRKSGYDKRPPNGWTAFQQCSHYVSHRHDDLNCWKRLTCQSCGKIGHPSDRCLFVCRGCGEIHDSRWKSFPT